MLRASGEFAGDAFNLEAILDSGADSGVPHGALLMEFVEAVIGGDEERLVRVRQAVLDTLGAAALVDAAGAVASFNAVVKVADGTGLEVDAPRRETATAIRQELGLSFGPRE